jgi:hypothetical protein
MNIEKQVCSLELAKRLKELGVKQESYFMWEGIMADVDKMHFKVKKFRANGNPWAYSAFTTAELGEMLPATLQTKGWDVYIEFGKSNITGLFKVFFRETSNPARMSIRSEATSEADVRAQILIWLIEQKLITV